MKIGWVSVSPWAKTGYGRITRDVVSRLLEKHDVMCLGHETDVLVWGGKKELTFPNGRTVTTLIIRNPLVDAAGTAGMVKVYAQKHKFDILLGFWDVYALDFLNSVGVPFMDYIPIDAPMTQKWVNYAQGAQKVILYSRFGYREAAKFIAPSRLDYVPHGVDTKAFRPLNRDKNDLRELVSATANRPIPKDVFLFVNTAANYGARKHLPLLLETFARFIKDKPAHLYLHTNFHMDAPAGYDLASLIDSLGISEHVSYPTYDPIIEPVEDVEFANLYNAADVYISNSVGEGFGMPVIESMACGIPAIAPDNSTMPELVKGRGWLVGNVDEKAYADYPVYVPTMQRYPVPDQLDMLKQMRSAYSNPERLAEYGARSRSLAVTYDWDVVMQKWFSLLETVAEDIRLQNEIKAALKRPAQ